MEVAPVQQPRPSGDTEALHVSAAHHAAGPSSALECAVSLPSTNDNLEDLENPMASIVVFTDSVSDSDAQAQEQAAAAVVKPSNPEPGAQPKATRSFRCCTTRRSRLCAFCGMLALTLTVLACVFLWPHDPTWEVKEISIDDTRKMSLVQAILDPSFSGSVSLPVNATVEFRNKNYLGAHVGVGRFAVSYGDHLLAHAESEAMTVKGQDAAICHATATSIITPELGKVMMDAVQPNFKLQTRVQGGLPLSKFGLRFRVELDCRVEVDVMKLMQDPNKLVSGHECKYSYRRGH